MSKIDSGHSPDDVPRIYREMNERIIKTAKMYSSDEKFLCVDYLNTLAFNISFR